MANSRKPEIMADAAYLILTSDAKKLTGRFFIDDEVLAANGIHNFEKYKVNPQVRDFDMVPDLFV